jgi:hypothetical protein
MSTNYIAINLTRLHGWTNPCLEQIIQKNRSEGIKPIQQRVLVAIRRFLFILGENIDHELGSSVTMSMYSDSFDKEISIHWKGPRFEFLTSIGFYDRRLRFATYGDNYGTKKVSEELSAFEMAIKLAKLINETHRTE